MKNVPNIARIHLLSGHLHGCNENAEWERLPSLLGWQRRWGMTCDSCDRTEGGVGRRLAGPPDPITPLGPLSDPAAWLQPLGGQYWSLVRRTSCPPSQSSTGELSSHPAITPPLTPTIYHPARHPFKRLVKSAYLKQVKTRGQWGRVPNAHSLWGESGYYPGRSGDGGNVPVQL